MVKEKKVVRVININFHLPITSSKYTVLLLAILLFVTPASAQNGPNLRYNIIDLGTLGGDSATAFGINESSQVTGTARVGIGPDGLAIPGGAFLGENGVMTNLGTLGSDKGSAAYDINDLGQIVGEASRDEVNLTCAATKGFFLNLTDQEIANIENADPWHTLFQSGSVRGGNGLVNGFGSHVRG